MYKLDPSGTESVLQDFANSADGWDPMGVCFSTAPAISTALRILEALPASESLSRFHRSHSRILISKVQNFVNHATGIARSLVAHLNGAKADAENGNVKGAPRTTARDVPCRFDLREVNGRQHP